MSNYQLGRNGVLYISATPVADATVTAATTSITGGTPLTNVQDVKSNLTADKADVSVRGGSGWKASATTLKEGTITFSYIYKTADTNFALLVAAYTTNAEIFAAALDEATAAGAQGPCGNWTVSSISRDETLSGAMKVDVELQSSSNNSWFVHA